eukprot:2471677-Rhodomonas_salina.1
MLCAAGVASRHNATSPDTTPWRAQPNTRCQDTQGRSRTRRSQHLGVDELSARSVGVAREIRQTPGAAMHGLSPGSHRQRTSAQRARDLAAWTFTPSLPPSNTRTTTSKKPTPPRTNSRIPFSPLPLNTASTTSRSCVASSSSSPSSPPSPHSRSTLGRASRFLVPSHVRAEHQPCNAWESVLVGEVRQTARSLSGGSTLVANTRPCQRVFFLSGYAYIEARSDSRIMRRLNTWVCQCFASSATHRAARGRARGQPSGHAEAAA